jgi:hypothetical protein
VTAGAHVCAVAWLPGGRSTSEVRVCLTLLLVDGDPEKYNRAALRWHVRFVEETKNVDIRERQAVLALLTTIPANALAAAALAELLSRRRSCEWVAEGLFAGRVRRKTQACPPRSITASAAAVSCLPSVVRSLVATIRGSAAEALKWRDEKGRAALATAPLPL